MFEFVVWAQNGQGTRSDTVTEEDLRGSVNPRTRRQQQVPFRGHIVPESIGSSFQGNWAHQQHRQDHVGEQRREPDNLTQPNFTSHQLNQTQSIQFKYYVTALIDSFPNDEVDDDPAEQQRTQKFPAHRPQVFDTIGDTQYSVTKPTKNHKSSYSMWWTCDELVTYVQYSSTGETVSLTIDTRPLIFLVTLAPPTRQDSVFHQLPCKKKKGRPRNRIHS